MTKPPKTLTANIVPFGLRMQPELKEALEEKARESGRSLNAEIVARLERSIQDDRELLDTVAGLVDSAAQHEDGLDNHERRLEKLESRVADLWLMMRGDERE